jgi:hypothetical protein
MASFPFIEKALRDNEAAFAANPRNTQAELSVAMLSTVLRFHEMAAELEAKMAKQKPRKKTAKKKPRKR